MNTNRLARALLRNIEYRGKDATGAAWRDAEGRVIVQKRALPASEFAKALSMPRRTQTAVLHTRMWTQGSPSDPNNNHPIITGPIVGVHNGSLSNDYELFAAMGLSDKRQGAVDSEAVFAALAYGLTPATDGKPRLEGVETLPDVLSKVEGSAAIGWLNEQDTTDTLHVARLWSSPLVWGQTAVGSFIFASSKMALEDACKRARLELVHIEDMSEGVYHRIRHGMVVAEEKFEPAGYGYLQNYRKYMSGGTSSFKAKSTGNVYEMGADGKYHKVDTRPMWERDEDDIAYGRWQETNELVNGGTSVLSMSNVDSLTDEQGTEWKETAEGGWVPVHAEAVQPDEYEWDDADIAVPNGVMVDGERVHPDFLNQRFLNLDRNIARPTGSSFSIQYTDRIEAIDKWKDGVMGADFTQLAHLFTSLHVDLRPGDWVVTDLFDDKVYAQVYRMPSCFPGGHYTLRAVVRNERRSPQYEAMFITRLAHEFESAGDFLATVMGAAEVEVAAEEELEAVDAGN